MNRRHLFQLAAAAAAFRTDAIERVHAATNPVAGTPPDAVASNEDFWAAVRE